MDDAQTQPNETGAESTTQEAQTPPEKKPTQPEQKGVSYDSHSQYDPA